MTRLVVAAQFRWDEYPGLRPGRIAAGLPDVARRPLGETHAVETSNAAATVCGLPRGSFPHEFPATIGLDVAEPCATCEVAEPGNN